MAATLKKRIGLGCTLGVDAAGGTTFVVLGNVVDTVNGPDAKSAIVPSPLLGDNFDDKLKGSIDGGSVTMTLAYDPDFDGCKLMGTLFLQRDPVPNWQLTYPSIAAPETFKAHVESLGREVKRNEYLVQPVTLAVVGDPGFARQP